MSPELNLFGTINYKRSLKANRIAVKILPDGLLVTLPLSKSPAEANAFILSIRDRILQKQQRIQQRNQQTILTEEKGFKTLTFQVHIEKADRKNVFFQFQQNELRIEYPQHTSLSSDHIQKVCWKGIHYFMKKEAKRILPGRVSFLANQHGFAFKDVKIQSGKTRWGSCSSHKNINLSMYLMMLSPELVDYVILHELCHTVEMNHGERFWKLMDKVTDGKTDRYRRELKKYPIPE